MPKSDSAHTKRRQRLNTHTYQDGLVGCNEQLLAHRPAKGRARIPAQQAPIHLHVPEEAIGRLYDRREHKVAVVVP